MKNVVAAVSAVAVALVAAAGGEVPSASVRGSQMSCETKKALVVMLDGFRADALDNADAPNMRSLRDGTWREEYKGAYSLSATAIRDASTYSAPNHVAIACGVTAAKSCVKNNGANRCDHAKWPSWLVRLVEAQPERKTLFAFEWPWDASISPNPSVEFVNGFDADNAAEVAKRLAAPDGPDATLFYINAPDYAGHGTAGFYPCNAEYLGAVHVADCMIGDCLAAIASRPTFKYEDWLIVVTSDHGGFGSGHTGVASHGTTIPLIVAGRRVEGGRIPGIPCNCDIAPTVLGHFGVDVEGMGLDGTVLAAVAGETGRPARPLKEGLVAYLPFDDGGKGGVVGGCLNVNTGKNGVPYMKVEGTENTNFENDADFALTMWVKMDGRQNGDPLLAGNKDWRKGTNPGLAVTASKALGRVKEPGVCLNAGSKGEEGRVNVGVFIQDSREWVFYAATRTSDGVVTFFQGMPDGRLYFISEDGSDIVSATGMPFYIGQDGTGTYKDAFAGSFDEFALWGRSLSHGEVRRIFEAGRRGVELRELIGEARYSSAGKRK